MIKAITRLENATITHAGNVVIVEARTGGMPSNPQPSRSTLRPRAGQTVDQLFRELVAEWTTLEDF